MTFSLDFGTIITTLVAASIVGIAGLFIRITKIETKFSHFQKNFDRIELKFEKEVNRLEGKIDTEVGRIEKRFERVDDELKDIKGDIKELRDLIITVLIQKNPDKAE